jgi:hypothetical protein
MVYFQTKNPILGKFWKVLQWKMLVFYGQMVYFMAIWYIMWSFGIFFPFWYIATEKNLATLPAAPMQMSYINFGHGGLPRVRKIAFFAKKLNLSRTVFAGHAARDNLKLNV